MFRRRWSGLPADPIFPSDLTELGYFVNDIDEIRSIEDPDSYFKYFLTKNERWNERQRFAMNEAISKIIHSRLDAEGLISVPLPLGTLTTQPHVPIRVSSDLASHTTRVVLLFGESSQESGVLAHRVLGGRGGITKGSVLGLVKALKTQRSSAADPSPPGIVIANPGELWWWPEGGRGLTPTSRHCVPMSSAVHYGRYHDEEKNGIPGNRTVAEHVRCVFEDVVMKMVSKTAKVDVIAVGDVADAVEGYLDEEAVWERVGGMMNSLVVLGGFYDSAKFKCGGFKKFMKERGRAYVIHHTPLDNPVAGAGGNPRAATFTSFGCPVYSAGDAILTEQLLIEAQLGVLGWIQQVALEGEAYKNEEFEIIGEENGHCIEPEEGMWGTSETNAIEKAEGKEHSQMEDGTVKGGEDACKDSLPSEEVGIGDTSEAKDMMHG
ncbi:Arb2 domain-containing protein [Madurella fahalii]|uniref:Arb2 domain-containing protein n=1 Tax=Madurella fahalii TaxID=1157608 RepID=A0ABQ0G1I6_9PEZI